MNIEEIKKEYEYLLQFTMPTECDSEEQCNEYYKMLGRRECLKEILDKHNNQFDYKSAFNDLVQEVIKEDCHDEFTNTRLLLKIQYLEQKYNLGGE